MIFYSYEIEIMGNSTEMNWIAQKVGSQDEKGQKTVG